ADLGLSEPGALGGDANVASHRQLASAAQTPAANGGDDRQGMLLDAAKDGGVGAAERVECIAFFELGDVGAGRESFVSCAAHDQHADALVLGGSIERFAEVLNDLEIDRVSYLGAVEG